MAKKLTSINKLFKDTDKRNYKFWRHLGVSIDKINEYSSVTCGVFYKKILQKTSLDELMEFEKIFNIEVQETNKSEKIEKLCSVSIETKKEILILRDFLSRKKKTVINYYNTVSNKFDITFVYSQIIQLKQLLDDSILHMISIYTSHNWLNKSTGIIYSLGENVSFKQAISLPEKSDNHFVNELYKKSNQSNYYRVFSYTSEDNAKVIVIIYRQVNDASIPDFDEPFRNKEVAPIMFQLNTQASVLEIKSKFKNETRWIKEYIEENFNISLSEIKPDVFDEYEPYAVRSAFLEGESNGSDETLDFTINKISFRSSPLVNSPRLSFSLENGDIFTSVKDAYYKECIELESLKDIESISFKSQNIKRTIRSTILDDGNILFSVNDSGMSTNIKQQLEDNFMQKFGIPLNKLITNIKFVVGKADVTDYLMTLSIKEELNEIERDIFNQLTKDGIIHEYTEENIYCKNPDCNYIEPIQEDISQCPECSNPNMGKEKFELLDTSINMVRSYVKDIVRAFCDSTDWEIRNESEKSFFSKKYKFINLVNINTSESFQVLIHYGSIQNKFIEKINRTLTPTVIIFVGVLEKHLSKYNNHCIFPVNFGRIYNMEDSKKVIEQIYEQIEHRSKSYLSSVANKSFYILKELPDPHKIKEDYTPTDFENDVFNIFKDIFPNADKWGNNMTGKEVPEGIFSINYNNHGPVDHNVKYVYSYDCKLNKNTKGYDLSKDEQRKAIDYVETLNQVAYVNRYSTKKQLSSHIFISNNFNENNFETMTDHFYKKLPDGYDTRPIFLPLDVLVYFHSEYRKNYNKLHNSRNYFMQCIHEMFITDKMVINKEDIDYIISTALDEDLAEFKDIDTKKVKKSVLEKIEKRG